MILGFGFSVGFLQQQLWEDHSSGNDNLLHGRNTAILTEQLGDLIDKHCSSIALFIHCFHPPTKGQATDYVSLGFLNFSKGAGHHNESVNITLLQWAFG